MALFKIVFFAALALFAGVGIFIGGVTMLTSLQNSMISMTYTSNGKAMAETVTRAADSARFWRLFLTLGALPVVLGAVAMWYAIRKLRS